MKQIFNILMMFMATALPLVSCSQTKKTTEIKPVEKAIVCYFSATGTTEAAAKLIEEITGADIYEIAPAKKYTSADLDWTDSRSRSYIEMHNRTLRPALKDSVTDLSEYSVVYIGYPNWWNTHPTIINTFIENNNLQGKTIVPFMTSGGGGIIKSEKELKEQYPGLIWGDGILMNGKTEPEIEKWTKQFK